MDILTEATRVFDIEIRALEMTRDALDNIFAKILDEIINCEGKVILTGIGKSGHIATKIAATFASLGTPSIYLHPAEAMHGDLGIISEKDIVIAISYSGESDEIVNILPSIKIIGAKVIALTGNEESTLAQNADVAQIFPRFIEACYLGLAPTSSTTVELVYGDALAIVASGMYGFKELDFGKYHPAGSLGKKIILKVDDLMAKGEKNPIVRNGAPLKDAIIELGKKGLGIVSIVDDDLNLLGVITNGDIRRELERKVNLYDLNVSDIMSRDPVTIESGSLAVDAVGIFKKTSLGYMPVVDGKKIIGTIRLQDIICVGIFDSVMDLK